MQGTVGVDAVGFASALDRDGYIVLHDVISNARLAEFTDDLLGAFDQRVTQGRLFEGGGILSGHLNCFPGEGAVHVRRARRARLLAHSGHRPDLADSVRATLNFNLPGSVAQHYHIDRRVSEEFLICNIAVVDTDLANGAIDVLPGTTMRVLQVLALRPRTQVTALTTRVPGSAGTSSCVTPRLAPRMPNRTGRRPSDDGVHVRRTRNDGHRSLPGVNAGAIEFQPNWFSPTCSGASARRPS